MALLALLLRDGLFSRKTRCNLCDARLHRMSQDERQDLSGLGSRAPIAQRFLQLSFLELCNAVVQDSVVRAQMASCRILDVQGWPCRLITMSEAGLQSADVHALVVCQSG